MFVGTNKSVHKDHYPPSLTRSTHGHTQTLTIEAAIPNKVIDATVISHNRTLSGTMAICSLSHLIVCVSLSNPLSESRRGIPVNASLLNHLGSAHRVRRLFRRAFFLSCSCFVLILTNVLPAQDSKSRDARSFGQNS